MDKLAPDDWSGWRVLADQLTQCGDEGGVLLEMAHRPLNNGHHHQAPSTLEYEIDQQVALWLVMNRAQIGNEEVESVEIYGAWRQGLARLKPVAPPPFWTMMGWS